ncbi:MAG: VCBS repeat-containing protein [Opitutaceae bacterium]|jgi:hypothetical protein|nr:VCBS repeat-containing protein [Opitutaceae bacterium]
MKKELIKKRLIISFLILCLAPAGVGRAGANPTAPGEFVRISYNNPGLVVDLAGGLWGWPVVCDRNGDGLPDVILTTGSEGYGGVYYFENTGRPDPATGAPIFKKAVRLSDMKPDITPSYVDGKLRVLARNIEYPRFVENGIGDGKGIRLPFEPRSVHPVAEPRRIRSYQCSHVDFDGDGLQDLAVGLLDYSDYGWDDAFDGNGRWINGPLHGYVYILKNKGGNQAPVYAPPMRLEADNRPVDVYGTPSPVFADFRKSGKLDLICGEFMDGLTYFENTGTRTGPRYATGRRLRFDGVPLTMPFQMIVVTSYDWNNNGYPDLVVSQEDGRVAWFENTGKLASRTSRGYGPPDKSAYPEFKPAVFFKQEADAVKFSSLSAPVSVDWDGDGLDDLIAGNGVGEIGFIKNLGGNPPRWAAPVLLEADGKPILLQAGYNGSVQGPCESKYGYANIGVGDWTGNGLPDILVNTISGKVLLFENTGTRAKPRLAAAKPLQVEWKGGPPKPKWNWWDPAPGELVAQWRCTPCMVDLDSDGIADLVTVDHEGYLAFYRQIERDGKRVLLPGERIFRVKGPSSFDSRGRPVGDKKDGLLRLNAGDFGASGRRVFCFADWDGDGKPDLLANSENVMLFRNISTKPGEWLFENMGDIGKTKLAGHSTAPTPVDWDKSGIPDMLSGSEDGHFYYIKNPRKK